MKKISLQSIVKSLLWSISLLALLLLGLGLWAAHNAEQRLGVVHVPATQWGKYVLKYSDNYRLQSVVTVAKYNSTAMVFRRLSEPYNSLEVIILATSNVQADALMFHPQQKDLVSKMQTFTYQGKNYPAILCRWVTKKTSLQEATLVITAIEVHNQRCYFKTFGSTGLGDWAKEFILFADSLVFAK